MSTGEERTGKTLRISELIQVLQLLLMLGAVIASYNALSQRVAVIETKLDFIMQERRAAMAAPATPAGASREP